MIVIKSWTEKHGGTIAVNSTARMGTEFTIALPVKANFPVKSELFASFRHTLRVDGEFLTGSAYKWVARAIDAASD
ncbi:MULTISPECIES: hypothetical protein [unclassified Microcoleus]|uniref:hypothetical protein n=1 Tax=unclassified Microcoleus TaxID=2642155 RepID=UPI002FD3C5D8